jgi:hypothetical protein
MLKNNIYYKKVGNMSNPSINRWGLNLFWYNYWFTDKNNSLTIHQDNLINKLILVYIHYGLLSTKNIFLNKYWYHVNLKNLQNNQDSYNLKYFRLVEYKNRVLNENKLYKIRNKIKNIYFSKIWILRYQKWLIVNFYCFQPLSNKLNKKSLKKKSFDFYLNTNRKNNQFLIHRYKFFLTYFLNKHLQNANYYKF